MINHDHDFVDSDSGELLQQGVGGREDLAGGEAEARVILIGARGEAEGNFREYSSSPLGLSHNPLHSNMIHVNVSLVDQNRDNVKLNEDKEHGGEEVKKHSNGVCRDKSLGFIRQTLWTQDPKKLFVGRESAGEKGERMWG